MRGIISGGQTGADRAALDVALELGIPAGGWCPAGRVAEDGPIASRYPLRETPLADPAQRTVWNVFDADATLVLGVGSDSEGTALTRETAVRFGRGLLVVEPAVDAATIETLVEWFRRLPDEALMNVAGPRESDRAGGYAVARDLFQIALGQLGGVETFPPRRVLITGGAGYLGRHLIELAPPGTEVHATVRRTAPGPGALAVSAGWSRASTGERAVGGETLTGGAAPADSGGEAEPGPLASAASQGTRDAWGGVGGSPAPRMHSVDLADGTEVDRMFEDIAPALVLHTAYGVADGERDIVATTRNVAAATARVGARLVHVSSDMVLDGENAPFTESAAPDPVNPYGRQKAEAERIVREAVPDAAIVRPSLITCFDPPDPRSEWVLRGLRGEVEVALFIDELRSPILVHDLARQMWEIARLDERDASGVWNLAAPESVTRYGLGLLIALAHDQDPRSLGFARSGDAPGPRPRDLRLRVDRADRQLATRARTLTGAAREARPG